MESDTEAPATVLEGRPRHPQRNEANELTRGTIVGRYIVIDRLGEGGMGVVYAAYDPELNRRVALKLVTSGGQMRVLREAQALARLSHPNVVSVHDVGSIGDRVFVAMELVEGETLSAWLRGAKRSWRDVVTVFVAAGRGLAAAHAAGIVHRDFKPANVLVGRDGRARVLDFGLARAAADLATDAGEATAPGSSNDVLAKELTRTGSVLGTPRYMPPEAWRGEVAGEAGDQFSFCVALYEGLYGERPFEKISGDALPELRTPPAGSKVPAWLRRLVVRGLALEPSARFPSMSVVIGALEADRTIKRKTLVASAVGALLVGAIGIYALPARDREVCTGAEDRTAKAWGPVQQQKLVAAFAASGRPNARAVLDRLLPIVDGWRQSWQQGYVGACKDTRVREVQSEHVLDLRMECLARNLEETRATLDTLAAGGGDAVDHALEAVRSLPAVSTCANTAALASGIAPPATPEARVAVNAIRSKLDRSRAQLRLARYAPAMSLARGALDEARATKYEPVIGEALLELGRAQDELADPQAAETFANAMITAAAAGDSETTIRAAAHRITYMARKSAKFPLGDEISRIATALAAHASLTPATLVDLEDSAGTLLQTEQKLDDAQARFERALHIATSQLPPDDPYTIDTLQALGALAVTRHQLAEAKKLFDQVLAAKERVYGKDHPSYADGLENVAAIMARTGQLAETKELRENVLAIRLAALGPDHPDVAKGYDQLGAYYSDAGDYGTAASNLDKALSIWRKAYGDDGVEQTLTLVNLGMNNIPMGKFDAARSALEKARQLREKAYGADDPRVAGVLMDLGMVATRQGRFDDAIELLEKARQIDEKAFGANDSDVLDAMGNLAATYMQAGKLREARDQTTRLLQLMTELDGPESLRVGMMSGNYGFLQLKLDDALGALASFRTAQGIFEAKLGKSHPNVAMALLGGTQALLRLKREAEAVPLLERALEIGNAAKLDPAQLGEMHFQLAQALFANAATRRHARSEATAGLALYEQAHDTNNIKEAKEWLRKH